ncbi:glycosyltransferase family 1 protein [Silicimonas algicola]|nr:glycosyltransferase family 1 protein [Silicimonas algicola]
MSSEQKRTCSRLTIAAKCACDRRFSRTPSPTLVQNDMLPQRKAARSEEPPHLEATASLPPLLVVCLAIRHGGVDVRIVQTARELHHNGAVFRVVVIEGSRLHQTLLQEGIPVVAISRRRADPRIVIDLVRLVRHARIGLVDAHNTQSQYWAALAVLATGVKGRVATVHSVYREDHDGRLRQWLHEAALWLCRIAGFRFIAVSSNVVNYLVETLGIPSSAVILSRNGMEALAAPPPPFDLSTETGWPEDSVVLAMIGRLDPRKGHRFLIDALQEMVTTGEEKIRLLVVGTGREERRLREQVAAAGLEGYVHFSGFRDDIASILTRTDLLCLPSLSEGLPYTVLEAARQSVPVLASRLEGTDDIFLDGETIFFHRVGDVADIRRRVQDLAESPDQRRRVGAAARRLFLEDLQVSRMLDETLEVYRAAVR